MRRATEGLLAAAMVLAMAVLVAGCGADAPEGDTGSQPVPAMDCGPAIDRATPSIAGAGGDAWFWTRVRASCRAFPDGDTGQARALKRSLQDEPIRAVARFHRTLFGVSRGLYSDALYRASADVCGITLGDDLFTDYRSWLIAHGPDVVAAVRADPAAGLAALPDARYGCGLGEPFGAAALDLFLRRTGRPVQRAGLPFLEDIGIGS